MNNKLVIIGIILAALFLHGCSKPAVGIAVSNNSEVKVEKLFNAEGCAVFRFTDAGRFHYYANCKNSATMMESHTEGCGKGCTRTYEQQVASDW